MSLSDNGLSGAATSAASDLVKTVASGGGVVAALSNAGFKSEWAYAAGFASIGASWVAHYASRGKRGDSKAQADRWGIFVGHWAPTFFALGVALKLEESS
jgi:hypothetical protein